MAESPSGCIGAVVLDGDAEAVAQVRAVFASRPAAEATRCAAVSANLRLRGAALDIRIVDAGGRVSERTVSDPRTAADLIESWARLSPLELMPPPLPSALPPAPAAPRSDNLEARRDPPPFEVRRAAPDPARPAFHVTATADTSVASDGSVWFGASLGGCVRFGPICAGVAARVAGDARFAGAATQLDSTRMLADLLVVADLPLRAGRVLLAPGIGVGFGWVHIAQNHPAVASDEVDIDGGGLRANAHLGASLVLGRGLGIEAMLALDAAPLAHVAADQQDGARLAGEPWGDLRAGIGLRYGAP